MSSHGHIVSDVALRLAGLLVLAPSLVRAWETFEELHQRHQSAGYGEEASFDYGEEASERRLYKLKAGQEDEWREMWIWAYAWMVGMWLLIAPHIKQKVFPWRIQVRTLKFLEPRPTRTFENFVGVAEHPALPSEPFQRSYYNNRPALYRLLIRSALPRAHRFILGSGALALTMAWWLRSAYYIHFKNQYNFLVPETVRLNFNAGLQAHKILLPVTAFILSLYMVFHVFRLYTVMDLAWRLQGRIYDLAVLLGTLLMPHRSDSRVQNALWQIQCHLNLAHVLAYEEVSAGVREATREPSALENSGLLAQESEARDVELAESRITLVFVWLSDLTNILIDARLVPHAFAPAVLEALTELLDAVSLFNAEVKRTQPIVVVHMMALMADLMCLLTPPMLAHTFSPDDPSSPTYFWPWAGSMILAVFYQGIISLAQALEMPFEDHIDGLNPDWALFTTERHIFSCLAAGEGGPTLPLEPLNLLQPKAISAIPVQVVPSPLGPLYASTVERLTSSAASTKTALAVVNIHGNVSPMKREQVPAEALPSEAPWAPREVGDSSMEGRYLADAQGGGQGQSSTQLIKQAPGGTGGRWGTLDQDLLQATRAALLVPREITLDDVSLERLETVTARPLSELAAALLRANPGPAQGMASASAARPLALTQNAHMDTGYAEVPTIPNQNAFGEPDQDGNGDITNLIGQYHRELRQSSDLRAQLAAVQTGLAAPPSAMAAHGTAPTSRKRQEASATGRIGGKTEGRMGPGAPGRGRDDPGASTAAEI